MHVELPKAKKFREFGGEYVMIVISIVTALALEHGVQTYHHRHLAQEASERIEAELRENQRHVESVLKHNQDMQKRVEKLREGLLDDIRKGVPEKAALERMMAADPRALSLSIQAPTLRHEAWDVAVANQAAGFIPSEKLERYAALYAHMRDVEGISNGTGNRFVDNAEMVALFSDLEIGEARARDLLRVLQQMAMSYGGTDSNLINLRDDFAKGFEPGR